VTRPLVRHWLRASVLGLVAGSLLFGGGCTGPAPDQGASEESPVRVYHVQLNQTKEKDAANRNLARAISWWDDQSSASMPTPLTADENDRPVHVHWQAPFYRVRLGPFASRSAAKEVLTNARSAFPKAFIAPEQRREKE